MKLKLKLASSSTFDGIKDCIAKFYVCATDEISLIPENSYWRVRVGKAKDVTPVVVRHGKRFEFGTL